MMWSFVRTVFVLFLLKFHEQGYATRYLPSIVWDHYNPILSCKCNWFHPETFMEIYDRFVFVCPTQAMNVALLDDQSRPDDRMNLNIFERRWNGTVDELKKQMKSGEFCDPKHQETQRKFTCRGGDMGQYKTMRFARDTGYKKDDIVVWFNNVDDGKASSLTSTAKRCAMALIAKVTWNVATKYNFDYKKNLDRDRLQCNDLNVTCNPPGTPTITEPTTTTTNSTTNVSTNESGVGGTSSSTPPTDNSSNTKNSIGVSLLEARKSNEEWDTFRNGFLAGIAAMLFIAFIICLIYCIVCRPAKKKNKKTNCVCHYNPEGQCQTSANNNLGSEKEADALPKKAPIPENQGINNKGFQPTTLKRGENPA